MQTQNSTLKASFPAFSSIKLNIGWLFSFKTDVTLTVVCIVLGTVFFPRQQSNPYELFWIVVGTTLLYDIHHAYMSLLLISDKAVFNQYKPFILSILFGTFFIVWLSVVYEFQPLLFSVVSLFHFLRQDYGYLMLSCRQRPSRRMRWAMHSIVFLPFFTVIADPTVKVFWAGITYSFLPSQWAPVLHVITCALFGWIFTNELHQARATRELNCGKIFRLSMIFIFWYLLPIQLGFMPASYLIALHGISYWYLCYRVLQKRKKHSMLQSRASLVKMFAVTLLATIGIYHLVGNYNFYNLWASLNLYPNPTLMVSLASSLIMIHYLLDTIIWRRSSPLMQSLK